MSPQTPLRVFLSYAPADEPLRRELETHLALFRHQRRIELWHDGFLLPGSDKRSTRTKQIAQADIILLLISPHFISTEDCVEIELERAMHRHRAHVACVVPILLCPTEGWQRLPVGELESLPSRGQTVADFGSHDEAWADIACRLDKLVNEFRLPMHVATASVEPPGGGYHPDWYVRRQELEQRALDHLDSPAQPAVLRGPELFGKSMVFHHVLAQLQDSSGPNTRIATIDFRSLEPKVWTSPLEFFQMLAERLSLALGLPEGLYRSSRRARAASPSHRLRCFLEEQLLPPLGEGARLVLAIDHADEICVRTPADSSLADDFFAFLRGLCDLARSQPKNALGRLRLMLAISHSPSYLLRSQHLSLFNFTSDILVGELTTEEIHRVASLNGIELREADLEVLRAAVGGHPYLVRIVAYRTSRGRRTVAALLGDPGHDVFDDYLRRIGLRLERAGLHAAARAIAEKTQEPIDLRTTELLERAGLVLYEGGNGSGHYRLRYPIYQALFRKRT